MTAEVKHHLTDTNGILHKFADRLHAAMVFPRHVSVAHYQAPPPIKRCERGQFYSCFPAMVTIPK